MRNRINWEPADLASSNSRDPETGISPPKHLKRHLCVQMFVMNILHRGSWGARLVKHLTLDFGSGHDLTVCEMELHIELCTDSTEPAWDSLSLSLCPSPARSLSLSLSLSK